METQTQVNDHDLLVEIKTKLDAFITNYTALNSDHEARIRVLEASNWKRIGASTLAAALVSVAFMVVKYLLK